MLTTKKAIENRRSIRKFKTDLIDDAVILELLNAARLAPSGCNAQPWRFKIVTDDETKIRIAQGAYNQSFIQTAPVILVCCADIRGYLDGTVSGAQDLGKIGVLEDRIVSILHTKAEDLSSTSIDQLIPKITGNVMIAIEHIILRALDFGLGSYWIRLMDVEAIKSIFGWDDNIYPVALLPLGYPDENPQPRKRLKLEDIILP